MLTLEDRTKEPRVEDQTQPFRFAEWKWYFGGRWPDVHSSDTKMFSKKLVEKKWAYVFGVSHGKPFLRYEIWIDKSKTIWKTNQKTLRKKISDRGEPRLYSEEGSKHFRLPFFNKGRPVGAYYIIYSAVRLPLPAIKSLEKATTGVFSSLSYHLCECFRFRTGARSRIYQTEFAGEKGDSVPEERFVTFGGKPAVMGVDLVSLAMRMNRRYLDSLEKYQQRFLLPKPQFRNLFELDMLAEQLQAVVSSKGISNQLAQKLRKLAYYNINYLELRKYTEKRQHLRQRYIRAYERDAAALCRVLDNPIFEILRSAHRFDEENPDRESVHAESFLNSYAVMLRGVECSAAGQSYLAKQCEAALYDQSEILADWHGSNLHFASMYILPTAKRAVDVAKITRHAAKASLALFAQFASTAVQQQPNPPAVEGLILQSLKNLYPGAKVVSVERPKLADTPNAIAWTNAKIRTAARTGDGSFKTIEFTTVVFKADEVAIGDWIDQQDRSKLFGRGANLLKLSLGVINVALSVMALRERLQKEGEWDWGRQAADLSAHTLNLISAVVKQVRGERMGATAVRSIHAFSALTGAYFLAANIYDARNAINVNDYDRAVFLVGAAVSEVVGLYAIAAAAEAAAAGTTVGPWGTIIGAVAGAAFYILAILSADSEFEFFLKHCKWGRSQYDSKEARRWTEGPISSWQNEPAKQLSALNNLFYAFTLRGEIEKSGFWFEVVPYLNLKNWIKARVEFTQLRLESELLVNWEFELMISNGPYASTQTARRVSEEVLLGPDELLSQMKSNNDGMPYFVLAPPEAVLNDVVDLKASGYSIHKVWIDVTFYPHGNQDVGTATVTLWDDFETTGEVFDVSIA